MKNSPKSRGTILVDLDKTLAQYDKWEGVKVIGPPVERMVRRVKLWLEEGYTVKVFTARVAKGDGSYTIPKIRKIIQDWTEKHIGVRLPVTCKKDFSVVEIWDDRAVGVIPNQGITDDERRLAAITAVCR